MKIISLAGLALGMLLSTSCLTSLQPLVTVDTIIEETRLEGNWQQGKDMITVEKLTKSSIYREIGTSIMTKGNEVASQKPLTGNDKRDSILYSHAYSITFIRNGITYYMLGALTKIGNSHFLEMYPIVLDDPQQPDGNGLDYTFNYLPGSTFARLDVDNNTLQLHFPDGDYIKQQVNNGNFRIKHEKDALFQTFLVTASTRDLRMFLEKYSHDKRLFNKGNSVTLTRKG